MLPGGPLASTIRRRYSGATTGGTGPILATLVPPADDPLAGPGLESQTLPPDSTANPHRPPTAPSQWTPALRPCLHDHMSPGPRGRRLAPRGARMRLAASRRGVEPLLERRAGEGGVRTWQQATLLEDVAVRVGRVTHALDLHRVTAPGHEPCRHVNEIFLPRTGDLRDRSSKGSRCNRRSGG